MVDVCTYCGGVGNPESACLFCDTDRAPIDDATYAPECVTLRRKLHLQVFDYIGELTTPAGYRVGQPMQLFGWQRKFVRGALGDAVQTSALSVARGNGKSGLVAALGCAALDGPLATPNADVIAIASSFEQGRVSIGEQSRRMLAARIAESPKLWRVEDSSNRFAITYRPLGTRLRVLGSDARRAHGLPAARLFLTDEPAQWGPNSPKLWSAIRTSLGKVEGARIIALGTMPEDADHWFAKLAGGDADYRQVYAAGRDDPIHLVRTWRKANPSLEQFPALRAALKSEAADARRDGAALAQFASLRLNQGVSDVTREVLIGVEAWAACERDEADEADRDGLPVWGVDLGGGAAMSALAAYWPSGRLECLAAFPSVPDLRRRGERDGVGRRYQDMADRGELLTLGGASVPVDELLTAALRRFGRPGLVVADRWRAAELTDALNAAGIPPAAVDWRGQGFRDGGEDVREFSRAVLDRRVAASRSLLLRTALAGAVTVSDAAGNRKLARAGEGGRRKRHRDDAAAASILAVSAGERRRRSASARPRRRLRYGIA